MDDVSFANVAGDAIENAQAVRLFEITTLNERIRCLYVSLL